MMRIMAGRDPDDAAVLANGLGSLISGAEVRRSDVSGSAAVDDPRLRTQIDLIVGRPLSQFSMGGPGIRLGFWVERLEDGGREVVSEHSSVGLGQPGSAAVEHDWDEEVVATFLLGALRQTLAALDILDGRLSLTFEDGRHLHVDPDEHYESWQISSDDDLLIVCTPGGGLTIWYPSTTP